MTTPITTLPIYAAALKAEFQEHGIYRGLGFPMHVKSKDGWSIREYTDTTCLIASRTALRAQVDNEDLSWEWDTVLIDTIGELTRDTDKPHTTVEWLNQATDDEVYAMLDKIIG